MPTVGPTLMLDRLGPKRSDSEFIKSKLEAPGEHAIANALIMSFIEST